ncbi:T9SS type A sorting domain-containing protein [Pseudopedobacter beijingensis]|uniref:T9SS type A sorting domain-containing protein n=1 Tax=Pseudopedobacter beijingensis TaxID=1207056 RepID=A0ABW4IEF5_9SPHI
MKKQLFKKLSTLCIALVLITYSAIAQLSPAFNTIYVKENGTGDGSDWSNATSLAIALKWAQHNEGSLLWDAANPLKIYVAKGVYKPSVNPTSNTEDLGNPDVTFLLVKDVQVYGGFPDNGNPTFSDRNWATNETILSGDLLGNDGPNFTNDEDNVYHVVVSVDDVGTALLDGFTITGGKEETIGSILVNGKSVYRNAGGGIYNTSSSPELTNLVIKGNKARGGGGISNNNSSPILTNVSIHDNIASGAGGGMGNSNSSPELINVNFYNNRSGTSGGAIGNYNSSPKLTNVIIDNNESGSSGGGIHNSSNSSPELTNVTIRGNKASYGGAMYNLSNSSPILTNVLISGNSGNVTGGIINNTSSSPILTNVTISGNKGAGLTNYSASYPILKNSIIWGNGTVSFIDIGEVDPEEGDADERVYTPAASSSNNLVEGSPLGNISGIPSGLTASDIFVAPQGVGVVPTTAGDYTLLTTSIAVNAGGNALYANLDENTKDLAGNPRVYRYNDAGIIDLGAYELQTEPTLPVSLIDFTAKTEGKAVNLKWWTALENNNREFIIYRSNDGQTFTVLNSVAGAGNSSAIQNYSYDDENPLHGVNYYKLVQVDRNGKPKELGVRTANFSLDGANFLFSPNPTEDIINISFDKGQYRMLNLTDLNGKLLQQIQINPGEGSLVVSLGSYPTGIYLLHLDGDKGKVTKKVVRK